MCQLFLGFDLPVLEILVAQKKEEEKTLSALINE